MKENPNIVLSFLPEGISRIKLNAPSNYNALSSRNINSLINIFKRLNNDNKTKVIIIEGAGKGFSAGHDLKEITSARENQDNGDAFFQRIFDHCSALMQLIVNSPQPVIAEVDGIATAAGCQLVASCDLAIASTESKFATPGVNIGLF